MQHADDEYDKYHELCGHRQPGGGAQERVLCRLCNPAVTYGDTSPERIPDTQAAREERRDWSEGDREQ